MGIQVCYYGSGNYQVENQVENSGGVLDYRWTGCADVDNCYSNPSQSEYESGWDITFSTEYLLNKELSFEVDVTACGCGMNSALRYFISMKSDGGQASFGYTGATYGTGYCDDSQPAELDIWEANSLTNVYTTHSATRTVALSTPAPGGAKSFYGRGTGYQPLPAGQHPAVHGCLQGGVSYGMSQGMRRGMVLSMSMWGSPNDPSSMTWMENEPNGPCPVYQNPKNP
ncbi:hypothetical protein DAPPUDRAFT_242598 [Daphnia pulex]|uniref:cellulose 1,4-beta-cellobiosidase (non-reducing end) n=1 Tax=Daphnia pulex TaxID=6669 RepID=E9GH19_DAPPU|nr:hypothetical protein DAPPUDRAFT_242598 [Daphnia pulex]|eukprot:EFX81267.1 hypothetical protein DAPPUDRAFT_242598 [Daphnia pulex]